MTIINHPSDGLYPELIVLARLLAFDGPMARDELLTLCMPGDEARLRGALSRWITLSLFEESQKGVGINKEFSRKRGESLDQWTARLPGFCRSLVLSPKHCQPLFGENDGVSADFVRGMTWLLTQDIFSLPRTWNEIEGLQREQVNLEKVIQNDSRWSGLRFWARYLGFATGDSGAFVVDPTDAIRSQLGAVFQGTVNLPANTFVSDLAERLPILDSGKYRQEVESRMNEKVWRRPDANHLSMSMSFALRRLELNNLIELEPKADAEQAYFLTGKNYRSLKRFTHVRLIKDHL